MAIQLLNGAETEDQRLDRIYPGIERHWASLDYLAVKGTPLEQRPFRSYTWQVDEWLDQGQEGRCVEFGLCHELAARPVRTPRSAIDQIIAGRSIYHKAQHIDAWDGCHLGGACTVQASPTAYEGTSVLAGAKVAAELGYYDEYRWGLDVEDLARMVGYRGPSVIGVSWYPGMFTPDAEGWIHVTGSVAGGHCILVFAVKVVKRPDGSIDYERSHFRLWNSWGPDWGVRGTCKISWVDMKRLIAEEGEVMLPVRRHRG